MPRQCWKMASKMLDDENVADADQTQGVARVGEELEEYDCGCKIRFRRLDYGEAGNELPRKALVVPEFVSCDKHEGLQSVPPSDSRLVKVRREYESFLNE